MTRLRLYENLAVAFLVAGILCGCGTDSIYAGSKAISSSDGWSAADTATFQWEVKDTLQRHDFFIDLRHDQNYPFSNLYVYVDVAFPNGRQLRDTIQCTLADERGNWLGSGFGNIVDHRIGFRQSTAFPLTGAYRLHLTHGMRKDPLPGILDVGFRLERAEQ